MTNARDARQAAAKDLAQRVLSSQADIASWLVMAKALHDDGDHALADALHDQIMARFPADQHARGAALELALKRGDFPRLAAVAAAGLALRPHEPAYLRARGIARRRQGDLAGAIADLRDFARRDPAPDSLALMELGRALSASKRHDEALDAFDRAVAKTPRHPPVLHAQIVAYRETGRQTAVDLAQAARAMHPTRAVFLEEHMAALAALARHGEVIAVAADAPAEQMQSPRARSLLARSLLVAGPPERAEAALVALMDEMPDAPWLYSGLVELALRRGDVGMAVARAEAGCRARPKDRLARLRLAETLDLAGDLDRADAELAALTEQAPDFPRGWMERARRALARGDRDGAARCYTHVLAIDRGHRLARRSLIDLAREANDLTRAFSLCWVDPANAPQDGTTPPRAIVAPAFPLHALEIARLRDDPTLPERVLAIIAATLPETATDHLPPIARQAESLGQPAIAAACYLALAERDHLTAQVAIPVVQHAHAMSQPALTQAVSARLRAKLRPEQRAHFDIRTTEICHGPDAALAVARHRGAGSQPRDAAAAQYLARLLSVTGHDRLAMRYLRRCLRHWPKVEAFRVAQIHNLLALGQCGQAETCLARYQADFPAADTRALRMKILLAADRRHDAMALLRAAMAEPVFALPVLESLMLAVSCNDLAAADWLGVKYRAIPRSNISASLHFGLTHPGSLLNDLRLFHATKDATAADQTPSPQAARVYFSAATQVLDQHFAALQAPKAESVIPRRIFQYWDSAQAPDELEALMAGWADAPGFDYLRLDARAAQQWLFQHYDMVHLNAFRAANHVAEASDFLRLCVLYRQGGIYMDSDNKRTGDAGALIADAGPMLLFRDPFGALPNDVIAATPRHPVIGAAMAMARDALLSREKELTWGKTGPGLLTRIVAGFLAERGEAAHRDMRILPLAAMRVCVHPCIDLPYKLTPKYWNDRVGKVAPDIQTALVQIAAP